MERVPMWGEEEFGGGAGFRILRFSDDEILSSIDDVITEIENWVENYEKML